MREHQSRGARSSLGPFPFFQEHGVHLHIYQLIPFVKCHIHFPVYFQKENAPFWLVGL